MYRHIGEEETSINGTIPELTDDPTWIIDPIDGTQNFVRYMPVTCISVGMTINKEQVLGIVFNPYLDELFTAIKGEGAYLNGKRIYTSGCTGEYHDGRHKIFFHKNIFKFILTDDFKVCFPRFF